MQQCLWMPMDFTKTQISRYLENKTSFFLQIKKFTDYKSRATLLEKNSSVVDVTFKMEICKLAIEIANTFWTSSDYKLEQWKFHGKNLNNQISAKLEKQNQHYCQ